MHSNKIIPVREQIAEQIRSDIISGELPPNTKLNEQALADRFGVSRGPVRDVLLQLTKEGLLVSKSNCGVTVNSKLDAGLQSLMVQIRQTIETHAAKKLVEQFNNSDIQALEDILTELDQAFEQEDFNAVTQLDIDFHHYLIKQAGGDELSNLWHPIVMRMRMDYERVSSASDCVAEHRAIIDALKARDCDAVIKALKANIK
ncbi:GntR family transcriptional regulator [Agaribacterium haliotis]|uniref:GntR family transcriptional regulator n=1 Tax=Agaribacterium haliotis TaxID=2013869 RepID=UPI000BB56D75|nr:GntR family transcriptional regulator [Agaribacterium haliotis]